MKINLKAISRRDVFKANLLPAIIGIISGKAASLPSEKNAKQGYATRSALAAVGDAATNIGDAYLTESGREGKFVFSDADLSLEVANDTTQSVYIAPTSDPSGASGAWFRVFAGPLDVRAFGTSGDYSLGDSKGNDDSAALQAAATYCDNNLIPSMYLPTVRQNYLVDSPIVVTEPGLRIHGDKGPSYFRGSKKNGNLIIGEASHAIQIGAGVGPGDDWGTNIADMWSVENIGFYANANTAFKSKTGIYYDRQTNGPDRGFMLSGISGVGLHSVFRMAPKRDGVQIAMANLVVENSCLSNNRYGLFSEAPIYGLRFVGNQAEQNNNGSGDDANDGGAIHGDFQGGITIMDNMLEGQPNAVNLDASSAAMRVDFQRNYIETNTVNNSEYVIRMKTSQVFLNNHANIGPNFFSGTSFPPGFATIEGKGNWTIVMKDNYPITFKHWAGAVLHGSKIFSQDVNYFRLQGIDVSTKQPEIYLDGGGFVDLSGTAVTAVAVMAGGSGYINEQTVTLTGANGNGYGATGTVVVTDGAVTRVKVTSGGYGYIDGQELAIVGSGGTGGTGAATVPSGDWNHITFDSGMKVKTPFGAVFARDATQTTPIPLSASAGDLVVINALVLVKDKTAPILRHQITTSTGVFIASLGVSEAHRISNGRWVTICMPLIVPSNQASLGFRYGLSGGTVTAFIAGVSVKNYGAYVNDGTQVVNITPVAPRVSG